MSKSDIMRAALHFPAGCFAAWLTSVAPISGVIFSFGFLTYEVVEDWRIRDRGYKDIFGFLVGFAVMFIILYVMTCEVI